MRRAAGVFGLAALALLGSPGTGPAADRPLQGSLEAVLPGDGRPVLLVFFSMDCPACFDDLLEMTRFVRREGLDVPVVGVCGGPKADIEAFVEKHSVRVPIVPDGRGRIRRRFKVDLLPYKIVLEGGKEAYRDDYYLPLGERMKRAQRCLVDLACGSRHGSPS